jgi:cytochrome c556
MQHLTKTLQNTVAERKTLQKPYQNPSRTQNRTKALQNPYKKHINPTNHFSHFKQCSAFGVRTALNAEWEPADGSKWVQTDFEKEINKLEKEAEERLDAKVEELKSNIASVGK